MKSHIGPNGPGKCTAEVKDCPFGGEDNHFETIASARVEYEARLTKAYDEVATVRSSKLRLTAREQELREKNAKQAKEIVALRAQAGGITYEDANPERAKRRLEESIAFAESRGNEYLVDKLSHATVLPSGAFKLDDGSRANVDKYLKAKQTLEAIEAGREQMLASINEVLKSESATNDSFQLKTAAGSFSLTLKPAFSQAEFDKLSPSIQESLKSPKEGLSIDAARENLSPKLLAEVTNDSQVVDFVVGKPQSVTVGAAALKAKLSGATTDEKVQSGLKNIADFYGEVHAEVGTVKASRELAASNNAAIKSATAKNSGPVFVPARSQSNGLVVTRRQGLSAAAVKDKLSAAQLKSITVTRMEPDAALASTILEPKTFGKIFGNVTASLRFTEAS